MTATPNSYLVVAGSGPADAIDAYLYGDNVRSVTLEKGGRYVAIVAVVTTGGFGSVAQADRLGSGMHFAVIVDTFDTAAAEALKRAVLSGIASAMTID